MSKKGFNKFLIVLLTVVALVGCSAIAILIYLQLSGVLPQLLLVLSEYFSTGARSFLVIFWGMVFPILMAVFFIILVIRRNKAYDVTSTWENGIRIAVETEKNAFRKLLSSSVVRFVALSDMDTRDFSYVAKGDKIADLASLCKAFEDFASIRLNLYFHPAEIREFIAGMAASHLIILQGVSGAGKTSLAYAFGEFIGNTSTIIPVQPMWKERADLLGYYNEFTKKYNETTLLKKIYEANLSDAIYITVLDEMNLARVEYYFADFLSLMEIPNPELRYLEIVSDKWDKDPKLLCEGRLRLPDNMWFVGTVNSDDSAYVISDKVYDRAMVLRLGAKAASSGRSEQVNTADIDYRRLGEFFDKARNGYEISDLNIRRTQALDEFLIAKFGLTFGNRIRKQMTDFIAVYVACGGEEIEALDRFLAKKVLRKLEYRDASVYRNELDELRLYLDVSFGKNSMPCCQSYINRISESDRR